MEHIGGEHSPILCCFCSLQPLSPWGPTSSLILLTALHVGLRHSSPSSCIFTSSGSFCFVSPSLWVCPDYGQLLVSLDTSFNIWVHQSCLCCVALPSVAVSSWFLFSGLLCFRWSEFTCYRSGHSFQNIFLIGISAHTAPMCQHLNIVFFEVQAQQLFLSPGFFFSPLNSKMMRLTSFQCGVLVAILFC